MGRIIKNLALTIGVVVALATPAWATPVIDGFDTGDWAGFFLFGTDANEGFQGDSWDISAFYAYEETAGGGLGNGLYFRMDTYAPPTFDGEPPFVSDESRFAVLADFDGDSAVDRIIIFNDTNDGSVNIYDGSFTFLGTAGAGALGSTVEWFVPAAFLPGTVGSGFQIVATLDNGGLLAEDFIPDVGFLTPIPEPGSALLLGFGLMGAAFRRNRRKHLSA